MGVPYYFYNIYKKYNRKYSLTVSQSDLSKSEITHLFLDYNSMIHPCAQNAMLQLESDEQVYTEDEIEEFIITKCLEYTLHTLTIIKPRHLYICIDGVAPCGKLVQQQERRYKSHFLKEKKVIWDTNKITPGTLFMNKLTNALLHFIKENTFVKEMSTSITLSSSNECGEGEHKMMNIIRDLEESAGNQCNSNLYGIYGLDADLIMLSLLSVASDKIVLVRDQNDTPDFIYLSAGVLKFAIFSDLNSTCISAHKTQLSEVMGSDTEKAVIDRVVSDHVFLCFLVGNDFLPGIPSLSIKDNGIGMISRAYVGALVKYKTYLTSHSS